MTGKIPEEFLQIVSWIYEAWEKALEEGWLKKHTIDTEKNSPSIRPLSCTGKKHIEITEKDAKISEVHGQNFVDKIIVQG